MKKISLLIVAGVLVSTLSFAGKRDDSPKTTSGMAVVRTTTTSYKLIYKSEEASDVKVEIFDGKNELVFTETIKKSDGFVRPYNFESLADGEYTIRIDNGSNWLTETVNYRTGRGSKLAHLIKMNEGKYLLTVAGKGQDRLAIRIYNESGEVVRDDFEPVFGDFAQVYDLSHINGALTFEVSDKSGLSKVLQKK